MKNSATLWTSWWTVASAASFLPQSSIAPARSRNLSEKVWVHGKRFTHDIETFPVVFAEPEFPDGIAMFPGAVTLIRDPAVFRIFGMEVQHVFIPPGFGENAGGCDGGEDRIALDDATMGGSPVACEPVAVDEQQLWPDLQPVEGKVHRLERGPENIDPIDLVLIHPRNAPGHSISLDVSAQQVPVFRGDLFGIIQQRMEKTRRQDYRSGKYRSCKTTAAGLIATGFRQLVLVMRSQRVV